MTDAAYVDQLGGRAARTTVDVSGRLAFTSGPALAQAGDQPGYLADANRVGLRVALGFEREVDQIVAEGDAARRSADEALRRAAKEAAKPADGGGRVWTSMEAGPSMTCIYGRRWTSNDDPPMNS